MAWRAVASTTGVVKGRAWNGRVGRAVDTHRRGWIGLVWDGQPGKQVIKKCGHAHAKRSRADECAASWARELNRVD